MRWIQMIFSFIMKRVNAGGERPHPMEEIKEFLKENAIKLFVGMVLIVTIGTMLTAGIYMMIAALTAQVDLGLAPGMNAMAWGGFFMALVPAAILGFAWYQSTPHEQRAHKKKKKAHVPEQPATMEQALVLLVTDFIEERQMKREFKFERERRMAEAEMLAAQQNLQDQRRTPTEPYQRH